MKLAELLNGLKYIQVEGEVLNKEVTGIEYDSRNVKQNSLFVAIKGFNVDGHLFIHDALKKGAVAVIIENNYSESEDLIKDSDAVKILVSDSRTALAEVSNFFYSQPSRNLNLFGITGTNGKTTVSYLIKNILEEAGIKTGLLGTISNYIGDVQTVSKLTTPESNNLNDMLFQMVNEGCKSAVMEVSSHALALKRVNNLFFSSAVFTNITPEHLDFHNDFESYMKAKKLLFDNLTDDATVVYNSDDEHSDEILKDCTASKFSYGTSSPSDYQINDIRYDLNGTAFTINHLQNSYKVETSLVGGFNAYNATAAFAICKQYGIDEKLILSGIKNTQQIPGRFEVLKEENKNVIVDYSHTPDSLQKSLEVIRSLNKERVEVITVFGC
ncbi:MAG: UDP-N-acetylmuramoyl-L-alanyl-D-glutamate--2,6-diaminopimelate ligase, partial [Candidatus Kariarchaeaceae archaeon]